MKDQPKDWQPDDYPVWLQLREQRQVRQDFWDACAIAGAGLLLVGFFSWAIYLEYSL